MKSNLQKLMLRNSNMSVSDLARATNLPQPTLHQLCTGATHNPRKKTLKILADFFCITIDQLLGNEPLPYTLSEETKHNLDLNIIPILPWEELENWPNINLKNYPELILETTNSVYKNIFALEMMGQAMEPLFPEGCLLIFSPEKVAKNGDCVIVYLDDTKQFLFKKLLSDDHYNYIKSINPELNNAALIRLQTQDKIFACLVEARIKY